MKMPRGKCGMVIAVCQRAPAHATPDQDEARAVASLANPHAEFPKLDTNRVQIPGGEDFEL
jgi:hypothetical protein